MNTGNIILSIGLGFFILFMPVSVAAITSVDLSQFHQYEGEDLADNAGNSLAVGDINGDGYDDLIIGAWLQDSVASSAGAVYFMYGGKDGDLLSGTVDLANADAKFTGEGAGYNAGQSLATGDINDDGYDDVLIGTDLGGNAIKGLTYVIYGKSAQFSGTASLATANAKFQGDPTNGYNNGYRVGAGDINGDGYDDILMADYEYDDGSSYGALYIVYGKAIKFSSTTNVTAADARFNSGAAQYVGENLTTGDINGDGYDDILVSNGYTSSGGSVGSVFLLYGKAAKYSGTAGVLTTDAAEFKGQSGSGVGYGLAAGDINADGYDDLLIGSSYVGTAGTAFVFYGKSIEYTGSTVITSADASFTGAAASDSLGQSVASGDFNGDGYADVLFGAVNEDGGGSGSGSSYLVLGKAAKYSGATNISTVSHKFIGEEAGDGAGTSGATGDLNGDGFDEIIVGAYRHNVNAENNVGTVDYAYASFDADGDGVAGTSGLLFSGTDCNDSDGAVSSNQTYYLDNDSDGYGDLTSTTSVCAATAPTGYVTNSTDCDDAQGGVNTDQTFYQDNDGDGLGAASSTTVQCLPSAPTGYVDNANDTDDSIKNNGVEIDGDGIDNDGDGEVDEVNTLAGNGTHPEYGSYSATDAAVVTSAISEVVGAKRGRIKVTYKDKSVYRYDIFPKYNKTALTKVKQFKKQGLYLVLHAKGKKLTFVNVLNGEKQDSKVLSKKKKYKRNSFKIFKIRKKYLAVVTSKKKASVKFSITKIKPKKRQLGRKSAVNVVSKRVLPRKTGYKKKTIFLRNKKSKRLYRYFVTKRFRLKAK